jgi:hypothetical protein
VAPQTDQGPERGETLAERLKRGPLPLFIAIHHACEIAKDLGELHRNGHTHGSVNGCSIELRPSGAVLLPPSGDLLPESAWRADILGYGSVLQSLLSDECPAGSRACEQRVWEAARRLTARCLADTQETGCTMQKLLTEIRVLDVLARQWERKARCHRALSPQAHGIWREPQPTWEAAAWPPASPTAAPPWQALAAAPYVRVLRRTTLEPPPLGDQCPRCGQDEVFASTPRTRFEAVLERLGMPVRRCHECSLRYFRFLFLNIRKGNHRRHSAWI